MSHIVPYDSLTLTLLALLARVPWATRPLPGKGARSQHAVVATTMLIPLHDTITLTI